jgi:hypothetical protein
MKKSAVFLLCCAVFVGCATEDNRPIDPRLYQVTVEVEGMT